jgi:hypothetical protein
LGGEDWIEIGAARRELLLLLIAGSLYALMLIA